MLPSVRKGLIADRSCLFSDMGLDWYLPFCYSLQLHWWEEPEPEGIPHPGQGGRHFPAKTWEGRHSWEIRLLVWPVTASHRDYGITDNCLRGICCCSDTLLISLTHAHKRASHFPSLSFSPTCLLPVLISIFHCQIHITPYLPACTHIHAHKLTHTHTHIVAQTKFARGEQQKLEGWFCCYCLTYQCLSGGSDLCMIYESLDCLKTPNPTLAHAHKRDVVIV